MKKIREEMDLLKSIIKGIAEQFGERCEVVLHDYDNPYDKTIVAIENGHVTGRKVGDCGTNLGLEVLRGTVKNGDRYNYLTQTKSGKLLRSSSIYIKNDEGKPIGAICINYDITDFVMAEKTLKSITISNQKDETNEVITNDINELLDDLIQKSLQHVGIPVALMNKEDKIKGLKFLDDKGAFLIKKSADRISKYYDISKFTLYNYLEEARNGIGQNIKEEL